MNLNGSIFVHDLKMNWAKVVSEGEKQLYCETPNPPLLKNAPLKVKIQTQQQTHTQMWKQHIYYGYKIHVCHNCAFGIDVMHLTWWQAIICYFIYWSVSFVFSNIDYRCVVAKPFHKKWIGLNYTVKQSTFGCIANCSWAVFC